jgi:serine/threonine protein kinase/Flp pilus assembly protein TadD
MSDAALDEDGSLDSLVGRVADEFLDRQKRGENPDVEEYVVRHPHAAALLRNVLASLRLIDQSGVAAGEATAEAGKHPQELGDFRIVREIGRGGMGIVYEAEQLSLGRKVALKVLPQAATLDPRRLQRFQNEARAAACLHHNNIVPVFFVGSDRGVHFYAMQLIDGQTLAEVIRDARAPEGGPTVAAGAEAAATTAPAAALSTQKPKRGAAYFRKVAELGAQAAEALDYAHQMGVVHRDVKPSNLMLDGRGQLWVADFGLALLQAEAGPTLTGDLVGTLRYMSPEQALAQRVLVDQRTDVYSLGATLYELLTLRPVFLGQDRQELLRQIAFDEPTQPRRLNRAVPPELETVVRKALEKNQQDRYATAQELADDLRRILEDKPIRARRPSWRQVAMKWTRRHRPVVWAAAAVVFVTLMLGGYTAFWWEQKRTGAEALAQAALEEASRLGQEERWPEALSATKRAREVLAGVGADPDLWQAVRDLGKDLEMGRKLQEARLLGTEVKEGYFDDEARKAAIADAFGWYGLDVTSLEPLDAAVRIKSRPIQAQLVAALDEWAFLDRKKGKNWKHLVAICRIADPDPWRDRLRDTFAGKDPQAMIALANSARSDDLTLGSAVLLAQLAYDTSAADRVTHLLLELRPVQPEDFWINYYLGRLHDRNRKEGIPYLMAAVALRPQSPGARLGLGNALLHTGQVVKAIAEYRAAIRLKKDFPAAHNNLGSALRDKGDVDGAIAAIHAALRLKPDLPEAHNNLGIALRTKGDVGGAIAEYRTALGLKKDYPEAHYNLGNALRGKGDVDGAIAAFHAAIRLKQEYPEAHNNLGAALVAKGDVDGAIAAFHAAIKWKGDFAVAHYRLGLTLLELGSYTEALGALKRGHELGVKQPGWHEPSAEWVRKAERLLALDQKLPAILKGEVRPADAAERLKLAYMCQAPFKGHYAASCLLYAKAFADDPKRADDLKAQHRYNAACAAAKAGSGQGKDAEQSDDKERGRLRRQALDWLRADLTAYRRMLEQQPQKAAPMVRQRMRHWQLDTDFASVRGPDALARLPDTERTAWQQLWADVANTLARAEGKTAPAKKTDLK